MIEPRRARVAGGLLLAATAAIAWLPALASPTVALFATFAAIAGAAFLAFAAAAEGSAWLTSRRVLVVAAVLRVAVVAAPPWLSDDVWRYLWEGEVARAGFSPYVHAPDSPALAELAATHADLHARVTHREIPAVYPPAAQLLFRLVPPSALAWRLLIAAADLLFVRWLLRRLARRGGPAAAATAASAGLLYAWNPLVVLEGAGSGHVDALGWMAALVALAGASHAGKTGARHARALLHGACAGIAGLLKPQGFVALLGALRPGARARSTALLGAGAAIVLCWLPFARDGSHLFDGLTEYAHDWEMNGLAYPPAVKVAETAKEWLEALPDQPLHLWKVRELGYAIVPNQLGRKLTLLLFLATAALLLARWRGSTLPLAFFVVAAFLATTPAVHPWYVAWLAPFLPFLPRATGRFALLLTVTTLAAHAIPVLRLAEGDWREPPWVGLLTWWPPCALFAWDCWRGRMSAASCDAAAR